MLNRCLEQVNDTGLGILIFSSWIFILCLFDFDFASGLDGFVDSLDHFHIL